MLSEDAYRAKLQATIAALRYWIPTISDVAHVEQADGLDFWKVSVTPKMDRACPFELMLRSDRKHDLIIAGEVFEDRPTTSLEIFLPLVEAIAEGKVVRRTYVSKATGLEIALEMLVDLGEGRVWSERRPLGLADQAAVLAEDEVIERHFLPYRR